MLNKTEYSNARKMYKDLIREKKRQYRLEMTVSLSSTIQNPELFWKHVRKLCSTYRQQPNIPVQTWFEHFKNVFGVTLESKVDREISTYLPLHGITDDDILNAEIDSDEIRGAIKKLRAGKSAGYDNILCEMLKCSSDLIVPYLRIIFNEIFRTGKFPKKWSMSIVVPIYKKGDRNDPNSYRGISLTSILSKVFVHVLSSRLKSWAEVNADL